MIGKILVVGTGGLAREFSSYFSELAPQLVIAGFSSPNRDEHRQFSLPGKLYSGEVTPDIVGTSSAVIAIGSPSLRKRLSQDLRSKGFSFPSFVHPTSVVSGRANLGEGVVIAPNCTVSPNVYLKSFAYLNFGVGVGHDAVVGEFCQINPGSQLGGGCSIGDETLVGSGSTVLQGIRVGAVVTIGSGSVVFSHVSDGSTMMGNPAKRMRAFEK